MSESPGPRPKKSKKKCTKDLDGCRSGLYAIRMKIKNEVNEIKWSDLEEIVIEGGTSCDAFVQSAFHKVWDRELNDHELDHVTSEFAMNMYELAFNRKY